MPRLDDIMERASQALARMDYLSCEALCLEALASARGERQWSAYARILMPLQETRRQRRIIAADEGVIRLGTSDVVAKPEAILGRLPRGCVLLTHPADRAAARAVLASAHRERRFVEVLFADNRASDAQWTLRAFDGPDVSCRINAPPAAWIDRWLEGPVAGAAVQPADWFIDASEQLGDAALAWVNRQRGADDPRTRLELLEACLGVVTDHEILHQRLGDAAKTLRVAQP